MYTLDERKKALDILWYELWMFNGCYERCNRDRTIENFAILESFLIHTRGIFDFLDDKIYDDNIVISGFNVEKVTPVLPLNNEIKDINKWLAHITERRMSDQIQIWDILAIRTSINTEFRNFLDQLVKVDKNIFPSNEGKLRQDFVLLMGPVDTETKIGLMDTKTNETGYIKN